MLSPAVQTILLLVASNVFMTVAWYGHLKHLHTAPLVVAIVVSWLIALAEYALQVPANRIGYGRFSLAQLKVIHEIVTMTVFAGYALFWPRGVALELPRGRGLPGRGGGLHLPRVMDATARPGRRLERRHQ